MLNIPKMQGKRIRQLRESRKIGSQKKLADLIGVSAGSVSQWENGTASPDHKSLAALSRVLRVSVASLFSEEMPEAGPAPIERKRLDVIERILSAEIDTIDSILFLLVGQSASDEDKVSSG